MSQFVGDRPKLQRINLNLMDLKSVDVDQQFRNHFPAKAVVPWRRCHVQLENGILEKILKKFKKFKYFKIILKILIKIIIFKNY
jgi:hypothetical protein